MNPISLNLIAITIFVLTMSSLLGPLIHLSPVVPAIAAFGMLGLVTVDTLALNNQGSTILLDWIAGASSEHRLRVVRHEAGHFLVAYLLGVPVAGYTLTAWESFKQGQKGRGGVRFDDRELVEQVKRGQLSAQLLNQYGTVWMAGMAAEILVYDNAEGGADDRQQLATLLAQLRPPVTDRAQRERWAALQAKTLLQAHWSAYEALVEAMVQRLSVSECYQAIERQLEQLLPKEE